MALPTFRNVPTTTLGDLRRSLSMLAMTSLRISLSRLRRRSSTSRRSGGGSSWVPTRLTAPPTVPPALSSSPLARRRSPVIRPPSRSRTLPSVTTTSPWMVPRTSRSPSTRITVPSNSSPGPTIRSSPTRTVARSTSRPSRASARAPRALVLRRRAPSKVPSAGRERVTPGEDTVSGVAVDGVRASSMARSRTPANSAASTPNPSGGDQA